MAYLAAPLAVLAGLLACAAAQVPMFDICVTTYASADCSTPSVGEACLMLPTCPPSSNVGCVAGSSTTCVPSTMPTARWACTREYENLGCTGAVTAISCAEVFCIDTTCSATSRSEISCEAALPMPAPGMSWQCLSVSGSLDCSSMATASGCTQVATSTCGPQTTPFCASGQLYTSCPPLALASTLAPSTTAAASTTSAAAAPASTSAPSPNPTSAAPTSSSAAAPASTSGPNPNPTSDPDPTSAAPAATSDSDPTSTAGPNPTSTAGPNPATSGPAPTSGPSAGNSAGGDGDDDDDGLSGGAAAGIAIAVIVVVLILALLALYKRRQDRTAKLESAHPPPAIKTLKDDGNGMVSIEV